MSSRVINRYVRPISLSPRRLEFAIEQGLETQHPSRIEVSVAVAKDRPIAVRVAGRVVPLMRGTLTLP